MRVSLRHGPSAAIAYCTLDAGEAVLAEPGAMVSMSGGMHVSSTAGPGGVVRGVMRKALAGEKFFMTRFTANVHNAWVGLASPYPGDLAAVDVTRGTAIMAESGALLALSENVNADPRWSGARMLAMREGAIFIKLTGQGTAILAAFGGLERTDLTPGQTLIFDSGHIVAYTESLKLRVGPLGGMVTSQLSGEGLVAEITGPGTVWTQTRSPQAVGLFAPNKNAPRA